jgi:hypothetical protein
MMTFYIDLSPDNTFLAQVDLEHLHQKGMAVWSDKGGGTFSFSGDELRRP